MFKVRMNSVFNVVTITMITMSNQKCENCGFLCNFDFLSFMMFHGDEWPLALVL